MGKEILNEMFSSNPTLSIDFGGILKIPLILVLIGCLFYAFMLFLKLRILKDTIDLEGSTKMRVLVFLNLIISLIVSIVGTILIVLG